MSVKIWLTGLVIVSTLSFTNSKTTKKLLQGIAIMITRGGRNCGNVTFTEHSGGFTTIWGRMEGIRPGKHGLHIHELGDVRSCTLVGVHYNPLQKKHGSAFSLDRHVGDLGNVFTSMDGSTWVAFTDNMISLRGPYTIVGRSIVTTARPDDAGKGGYPDSLVNGHSGPPIACGVIGYQSKVDKIFGAPGRFSSVGMPVPMKTLLSLLAIITIGLNY